MRLHAASTLALAALLAPARAIFEDDAYHIDFHHALIGLPKRGINFQKPYAASKASLLYAVSHEGAIGAINPRDGELVWRQIASSGLNATGLLRTGEDQDTVVSALGNHVAAWSAADGRIVWETSVDGATVEDLELLEQEDGITNSDAKDVLTLLSDQGLKRLDGKTGREKWTFQDTSGDTPLQISTSPTTVYYIALHTQLLGGAKLRVTSLSPITGKKIDQYTLSSEGEIQAPEHVLFAGANTAAPLLAWTDKSNKVLKINIIGTKGVSTFNAPTKDAVEKIVLHAPSRVNSLVHFLVEYHTATAHSAEVFHVDLKKGAISKAYSLPELKGQGAFTTTSSDANVYFTRITTEEVIVVSSVSHGILGRWPVKRISTLAGAYPIHGASEVVMKGGSASAVRSAVLFSNGQWVLIRNGEIAWSRPEFLSRSVSAVWAGLPEEEALAHELEVEGHQDVLTAYIHRVNRHIRDLKHFPTWVKNIPNRVLGSLVGKASDSLENIQNDNFGFHKFVVLATAAGQLAALDVGSQGKQIWHVDLAQLAPETVFEAPTLKAYRGYIEIKDSASQKSLYINSTTGGLLSSGDIKTQLSIEPKGQTLISFDLVDGDLKGFLGADISTQPIWSFTPPNGEKITGYTARPTKDPVASIGRVLGDRRVLYKYLNPNLVLVTAVLESTRTASFYLLDSASGQLLHAISHEGVDVSRPMPSTISENWLSYSVVIDSHSDASSRGYQLVVAELFESPLPDDRGPLRASSNSSTVQPSAASGDVTKPFVMSQTYQIPELISHMTVTQTKQGITSRELLVTCPDSNSIIGIPRHVIDPRRPIGRDPTSQEQSEGLTKYMPFIPFDPKWHLNHKYEVAGVKEVITSESGLESTSLVLAHGFDVFGTRVAPSFAFDVLGKGFNKIQMLLTVAALFVGVLFAAPLVGRKQINGMWTMPS
ncbi:DUF1620-domain-containing protein [Polyplosphaeria fusca]|uniref:ER membrane protein complex subunit 1 n=1 Tax=Polyplosphaeria fusca TaxID=682080 RepID=A0A9P4V0S0_9PLEO|nr:DUF1620-domain-containing protein [Polyplosphaeria fusca]